MDNLILSTATLVGKDIKNLQGENLGTVKDITIDMQTGKVAYLVLAFGGFLGLGNKYLAIPLQAFTIDPDDDRLILNIEKERLEDAPGFNKDNIPDTAQREFVDEVHTFYGYGAFLKEKVLENAHHSSSTKPSSVNSQDYHEEPGEFPESKYKAPIEDYNTRNRDFDPDNNKSLF